MKLILILIAGFTALNAQALPLPSTGEFRFELMKCVSGKNGTIWASFGRMTTSDSPVVRYFPTEIVLFGKDVSARLLFPDFREALKQDVDVSRGRMHMGFSVAVAGGTQKNLLQIMQYDTRIDNAYVGNWTVSEDGKKDVSDMVACSLD